MLTGAHRPCSCLRWPTGEARPLTREGGSKATLHLGHACLHACMAPVSMAALELKCTAVSVSFAPTERHPPLSTDILARYRPPLLPHLPASVQQAIEKCWADSPELRPTAAELVDMLTAIQAAGEHGVG